MLLLCSYSLSSTVGRDKLLRVLQYFARFYAWYLYRTNSPSRYITPWEAIKKQFSLVRKALRIGKNVEHFKAAAIVADGKSMDPILKYCAVGRQLGYGTYLTLDTITYVRSKNALYFVTDCIHSLTLPAFDRLPARRGYSARRTGRG